MIRSVISQPSSTTDIGLPASTVKVIVSPTEAEAVLRATFTTLRSALHPVGDAGSAASTLIGPDIKISPVSVIEANIFLNIQYRFK